jgi:hypothetical protein
MQKIRDLVVDVLELLVLRFDQLLPAVGTGLFAVYLRVELGFEAILGVAKTAKLTAVDREGARAPH